MQNNGSSILVKLVLLALIVGQLAPPAWAQNQMDGQTHYAACEEQGVKLIKPERWSTVQKDPSLIGRAVYFPDAVGNFDSVAEARRTLAPKSKEFVNLLVGAVTQLAQAQREYAETMSKCLLTNANNPKICQDKTTLQFIQRDRQAVQQNWQRMRMGLALGFPSLFCADMCVGYENNVKHVFQWARPFAKPSVMGAKPRPKGQDIAGELTLQEAQKAQSLLDPLTKEILERPIAFWERMTQTDPGATPEFMRLREANYALTRPGPNGQPSFRNYWRQQYFEAIRQAPLLLFTPRANPSVKEMQFAYDSIARAAREIIMGMNTADTMQPWDYLNLTTRDVLMTYHGVIETLLSDPRNRPYCGIAERMFRERESNDTTKLTFIVGGMLATGVGCVLTGSTYIGLSLCAVASLGISAKTDMDAQEQARVAQQKASSSATPTLLVDDYQNLSDIDQDAVLSQTLRYLSLIDVAILGGITIKLTGRALIFYKRLYQFSEEIAKTSNASPKAVRAALRTILRDSPSLPVAKRAADMLAKVPAGVLTPENATDVGRACRAVAPMIEDHEVGKWAGLIGGAARGGLDSIRGFAVVAERAYTLALLNKVTFGQAFRVALDQEVGRIKVDAGQLMTNAQKKNLQQDLLQCVGF
jgi:hypothetical protein